MDRRDPLRFWQFDRQVCRLCRGGPCSAVGLCSVLILLVILILSPLTTWAQGGGTDNPAGLAALRNRAVADGTVHVIVKLNTVFTPESDLPPSSALSQRRQIVTLQDRVLAALDDRAIKVLAEFNYVPYLALEVDAAALEQLSQLSEVLAIQEDQIDYIDLDSSLPVIQ
ncbi:MAG: hypothetical protein R2932_58900, partial [Caldilineaceae bacterium]